MGAGVRLDMNMDAAAEKDTMLSGGTSFGIAVLLSLVFFMQGYPGLQGQSLTWDEPSYISAGYINLTRSDFQLNPSHPPLMAEIEAFPLIFQDLTCPEYPSDLFATFDNPAATFGREFLFQSGNNPLRMGYWSRLPVLVIGTLLILAVFLWGRRLVGDRPALVATALAAFCPNLLAHANLATEDLGCAAFMFAAVWAFWYGLQKESKARWILCGLVTGLALLSKYTALLLAPIFIILVLILFFGKQIKLKAGLSALAVIFGVSFLVIGAGYNFTFDYGRYIDGISKIYTDLVPDVTFYFAGKISDKPIWYYNLVALATKVPLSTLLLFVVAAAVIVLGRGRKDTVALYFSAVPAAVIVATSFFDHYNFGLRRILPALPFLYLFAAHSYSRGQKAFKAVAIIVLVMSSAAASVKIHPHYLSYFNMAAGGPEMGPYLFYDSNIDWGQDLPELAKWQRAHPDSQNHLRLFYFGTSLPEAYGVNAVGAEPDEAAYPVPGNYYAVSATFLSFFRGTPDRFAVNTDWLTKYRPVARAGYSIYIYRF